MAWAVLLAASVHGQGAETTRFEFSAAGDRNLIWGRGAAEIPRTLVLDSALPAGTTLDWILTGDEGLPCAWPWTDAWNRSR